MFTATRSLPRALPRTRPSARKVSDLKGVPPPLATPIPPPPPPSSARPSRLRGFALKTASLGFAGWAMIASQNEATIMLEQAQGITRAPPVDSSSPPKPVSAHEEHTGEGPDFEQTGVQSEGGREEEEGGRRELTQEEQDEYDNDPKNQAAYNEEPGEINWDCPCLGGMAHGPCGDQFRASFSCFVHSEEEPKGIECVESFKAMQNCFREYPEIYGGDAIDDDEEADDEFDRAHPPPSRDMSEDDSSLLAEVEQALGQKAEQAEKEGGLPSGLAQAREGGEQLFNVEGGALGGQGKTDREPNLDAENKRE